MEGKIYFSKKKGKRYIKKGIHTVLVVIHNKMNHLGFTFTLGMSRAKTWTTRTANPLQGNSTAYYNFIVRVRANIVNLVIVSYHILAVTQKVAVKKKKNFR